MRFTYPEYHLPKLLDDPYLSPYHEIMRLRRKGARDTERRITNGSMDLLAFASGHEYFGLHFRDGKWVFREWAPNASTIFLVGDFNEMEGNARVSTP